MCAYMIDIVSFLLILRQADFLSQKAYLHAVFWETSCVPIDILSSYVQDEN